MFSDSLYTVLSLEGSDTSITADIKIDADHKLYEGHFPGSPITPGVVQLQIIRELLELHFRKKLKMVRMRTCKFLQIVDPRATPFLQIDGRFTKSEVFDVTASITHEETVYLKVQASYSFCS